MSEQSREQSQAHEAPPADQAAHGGLTVEDDPEGTQNAADLAGTASSDDATVGYHPSANEADKV